MEPESKVLRANAADGTLTPDPSETRVVLISQWHLSPQTMTNVDDSGKRPQTENQLAIYHQVSDWIRDRGVQTIIAEGCEGAIDDKFKDRYNGWSLTDLDHLSPEQLEPVMTHVALKLKAEFKNKIVVICGDDLKLIKKHQLILSDLRGLLGFKLRLVQSRSDKVRYADYLQALQTALNVPVKTSADATEKLLNQRLKDLVRDFDTVVRERNTAFLNALHKAMGRTVLVIGALHIHDLDERMRAEGETPAIFTPLGLKGDEAQLVDEIRQLLDRGL